MGKGEKIAINKWYRKLDTLAYSLYPNDEIYVQVSARHPALSHPGQNSLFCNLRMGQIS